MPFCALSASAILAVGLMPTWCQQQAAGQRIVLAQGEGYRVITTPTAALLEIELLNADGQWIGLTRAKGEAGWYGYNRKGAGEVRSSAVAPRVARSKRNGIDVTVVTCQLEPGVVHRAEYVARPSYCLITSQIMAEKEPPGANIVRLAPRFDMDIRRLFCFALRDDRQILHTGTFSGLAARPAYVGCGTWGGPGCIVRALAAQRAYMAFFNPLTGPLVAFAFPRRPTLWRGAHHFVQLWEGGANYLYAGYFDRLRAGHVTAFLLCARRDGDLFAFEDELPAILDDAEKLVRDGVVQVPQWAAAIDAESLIRSAMGSVGGEAVFPAKSWPRMWKRMYAVRLGARAARLGCPNAALAALRWAGLLHGPHHKGH